MRARHPFTRHRGPAALAVMTLGSLMTLTSACAAPDAPSEPKAATPSVTPPTTANRAATEDERAPRAPRPADPHTPEGTRAADVTADFERLCAALAHDYIDGTLTDYYRDVQPVTALGRRLRAEGDASVTPGRALAAALRAYDEDRGHAPTDDWPGAEMPRCRQLFEELDDLE